MVLAYSLLLVAACFVPSFARSGDARELALAGAAHGTGSAEPADARVRAWTRAPDTALPYSRRLLSSSGHGGSDGDGMIWVGKPTADWRDAFGNLNYEGAADGSPGGGSVRAVTERGVRMWRVHKPAADRRAEVRGAAGWRPRLGETYYVGWRWRLRSMLPRDARVGAGVTVFQWKAYRDAPTGGRHDVHQNYPFALRCAPLDNAISPGLLHADGVVSVA